MNNKIGLRRIYRKSWPYDNLFGTLRHELDSGQRGVWNDLLDFAKLSRVRPGLIAPKEKTAYKHEWLAAFLNVPLELFEDALKVLKSTDRIKEDGSGIEILNWEKYQTEYDRQKPYREAKKLGKEIRKVCPECGYKAKTAAVWCPECLEKYNKDVELQRDYTGGKFGHLVQR